MFTRWAVRPFNEISTQPHMLATLMMAPVTPSLSESYDWTTFYNLKSFQNNHHEHKPKDVQLRNQLLLFTDHTIWIPDLDVLVKISFLVQAHSRCAGHRAYGPTFSTQIKHFKWKTIQQDTKKFVESCIQCLSTTDRENIPRPLEHSIHATNPNYMIHFY